jgi:hypothetical protein
MAPKKNALKDIIHAPNPAEDRARRAVVLAEMPAGFEEVLLDKFPSGYYTPAPGKTIQGLLQDRLQKPPPYDQGWTYTILLTRPCVDCRVKDGEIADMNVGQLAGFDERTQIAEAVQALLKDPPGTWEVFITAIEEIDLEGGKTLWRFRFGKRRAAAAAAAAAAPQLTNGGAGAAPALTS